ncbi:MAG: isomerase [Gammaproteobacteria bacterium]|nr:isomerase [Gammaproteobacteria bacterium]
MKWYKISNTSRTLLILSAVLLVGLAILKILPLPGNNNSESVPLRSAQIPVLLKGDLNYDKQVKPILERRCVVCHGCYDAPCQLKLSSSEGIQRGATEERVYEARRIGSISPTRLFIDAKNTTQWRSRGFYPVLNEGENNQKDNLDNSVMYRLLQLKQQHPQPDVKKLPDSFSLKLNRKQTCPTLDSVNEYTEEHPLWGMPYAMPGLSEPEHQTLTTWIARGSRSPAPPAPSSTARLQIKKWESFFNKTSLKQRLVNRYLYEHLFHAHIHFKGSPQREFYRLVRSTTPPGEKIDEIATIRPNNDPGKAPFYYRLLSYYSSIVTKNHIVYKFSDKRLERFRELFLKPAYTVTEFPPYGADISANPFKVFAAIPAVSRYRFMLDDAHFFIEGFIKGPVCRGQLALNVIEDQFWVVFFNPDKPIITNNTGFIEKMAPELQLPADFDSNLDLYKIWTRYWKGQRRYMEHKQAWFKKMGTHKLKHAMGFIWDGDGKNPNAALTVFRHFDSGSVAYGLVGNEPETTWVIDFPLLERIHYLLVADFNIYGNIGHRMSTRIYMDFLRMEGEDSFLAFLPVNRRKEIRDKWYIGQRKQIEQLFSAPQEWLSTKSVEDYQTSDPQKEFYQRIKGRLKGVNQLTKSMNHCGKITCRKMPVKTIADRAMMKVALLQGEQLHSFPDVAFVRVKTDNPEDDLTYSLIRNKAYKNVTSFLADARERERADIDNDTMTVVKWLEGSYPNFFFSVALADVEEFATLCAAIRTNEDYDKFVDRYGVRRTDPFFWEMADWFQDIYQTNKPIMSGLFDLNRYENR